MSDHVLLMTPPRSGPYGDEDPRAAVLRELGFTPIASQRIEGNFTCWVRHHWMVGPIFAQDVIEQFINPILERTGQDIKILMIDESGTIFRLWDDS